MSETHGPIVEYRSYAAVWGMLLLLTGVLVGASRVSPELAVWAMLVVTPLKAGLVFYYFMHLKYESALLRVMLLVCLAVLVTFIGMLFFDLSFR